MTADATLNESQLAFLAQCRSAALATISPAGQARLVPICFVLDEPRDVGSEVILYSPLDEKPKRGNEVRDLARVRDIRERPRVTLLFDRWSEDWSALAWVRVTGTATLMEPDADADAETHRAVVRALRDKYPQYREQRLEGAPLIRIAVDETVSWSAGNKFAEH